MGDTFTSNLKIVVSLIDEASKPLSLIRERLNAVNKTTRQLKTAAQKMGDVRVLSQIRRGNFDSPMAQFSRTIGESTEKLSLMDKVAKKTIGDLERSFGQRTRAFRGNMFGIDVIANSRKAVPRLKEINQILKELNNEIANKNKKKMRGMRANMLGFGLSALFTGMAIKRFATNIFRSLGNVFMQLGDAQNEGVKRTMELGVATKFLKFILFDTFANSDLYGRFVEFVVNAVNKISDFVDQHEGLVEIGGAVTAIAAAFGTIAMVIGQGTLGTLGILALLDLMETKIIAISGLEFFSISSLWTPVVTAIAAIVAGSFLLAKDLKKHPDRINLIKDAWDDVFPSFDRVKTGFKDMLDFDSSKFTAWIISIGRRLENIGLTFDAIGRFMHLDFEGGKNILAQKHRTITVSGILKEMRANEVLAEANRNASSLMSSANPQMSFEGQNMSSEMGGRKVEVVIAPESRDALAESMLQSALNAGWMQPSPNS